MSQYNFILKFDQRDEEQFSFLITMHEAFDYCFLSVYSDEYSFILLVASNWEINF